MQKTHRFLRYTKLFNVAVYGLFMVSIAASQIEEQAAKHSSLIAHNISCHDGSRQRIVRAIDPILPTTQWSSPSLPLSQPLRITVNSSGDGGDSDLFDGKCSDASGRCTLRAAIDQTNAAGGGRIDLDFRESTAIEISDGPLVLNTDNELEINGPGSNLLTIRATSRSALIQAIGSGRVTLTGLTLENGATDLEGGCLYVGVDSSLALADAVVQHCSSENGGGISSRGTLKVTRSTIRNNTANLGGGIFIGEEGIGTITNCAIYGNTAIQGAGVNNNGDFPTLTIINTTIAGNAATGGTDYPASGGAILDFGPLVVINATVAGNTSAHDSGGIADWASVWGSAPSQLRNTIIASNTATFGNDVYTYGIVSNGNNLIGSGPIMGLVDGVNGDIVGKADGPLDPRLAPLADNGGPTLTRALMPDSSALNTGNNCVVQPIGSGGCLDQPILTDQRGDGFNRRSGGAVDMGAYELESVGVRPANFDFDGDGRSDIAVFRPSDQVWYINGSQRGLVTNRFGLSTDAIVPADFDGDGKTDIATFREGDWYWINSTNGQFNSVQFGQVGDIPVPADFTGDGRSELAVYRKGVWWSLDLSTGQASVVAFGNSTDKPIVADYDGDGKADPAVYRNGEWHLNLSSSGYRVVQFGLATDQPLIADFDGDGKMDEAVYRNGVWYALRSTAGFEAFQFGIATDIPVPADYDGDGKADAAVFREGNWWIQSSNSNGVAVRQFGLTVDKPVPSAYLR